MISPRTPNLLRESWGYRVVVVAFLLITATFCGCGKWPPITIESEPPGANVRIDGKAVGTTPVTIEATDIGQKIKVDFETPAATQSQPMVQPKDFEKLKTAYIPLTANLPLFVALEQGFFEQHGLKVEAFEATSPNDIVTGIVAGEIDFAGIIAYSLIFPAAIRYPDAFKLYASCEETSENFTSSIITKKNSPIESYEDLRGKKIGVYTGLVQINFLRAILAGLGINENEVEIVKISPRLQIQGLVSGAYDALSSTEPTVNIAKIQGIAKVVTENPRVKYIMCPFPSAASLISSRLLDRDPEAARAVAAALDMAVDFINAHPERAKQALPKYTQVPRDKEKEVLADLKLFKYCKLGEENRLNVQKFADFLFENGIMSERIEDVNPLFGDYENACGK